MTSEQAKLDEFHARQAAKQRLFAEGIRGGEVSAKRAAELGVTLTADLVDVQQQVADFQTQAGRDDTGTLGTPLGDGPTRDEALRALLGRN